MKDALSKTITFGSLRAEGIRFGDGDGELQGPTWKQDILAATSIHLASTHVETYRTYLSTNLETYRTYKPRNLHSKPSQPGGPEGAGGYFSGVSRYKVDGPILILSTAFPHLMRSECGGEGRACLC